MLKRLSLIVLSVFLFTFFVSASQAFDFADFGKVVVSAVPQQIALKDLDPNAPQGVNLYFTTLSTLGAKDYNEAELFSNKSDLIIGIDATGNSKGHMYVILDGDTRVDGRLFYLQPLIDKAHWVVSDGMIFRYKNLPPENKKRIISWYSSNPVSRGATCIVAGEKILFDIGELGRSSNHFWFPGEFLDYMTAKGLTDSQGEKITPEVYLINLEIHSFWSHLPRWKNVPRFLLKTLFDPSSWGRANRNHN